MFETQENTQKTQENISKTEENELRQHLDSVQDEKNTQNTTKDIPNTINVKPYEPNAGLLDFLQDKPITIQRLLITKGLSPDQKKKVEHVFQANEHEISVNRAAIREILIDLCTKYPELTPYFSNKTIFLATWSFGYFERSGIVETTLSSEQKAE
jgi:hypothetical protein